MKLRVWLALAAALTLLLAACGDGEDTTTTSAAAAPETTTTTEAAPETTTTTEAAATTTTEAAPAAVGTAENPVKVLFVPSVSADEIIVGGDLLDETLTAATGLEFDVSVGTSYASTIEEMCASPGNTMGFIPAQGYVLANALCGVSIDAKSIRFGYDVYWTQFIVPRDSEVSSIEELAGLKWAYPDATSTSGFLVPSGVFEAGGIEVGESFEAGGHSAVARAVYNGEADFGTTFYSPYTDADGETPWDGSSADADIPADLVDSCAVTDGDIFCGDLEVQDARGGIAEEAPDVVQQVKIIGVSDPIPNDGVGFGPDFPADLKQQILDALFDFAETDPDGFATAFDAYSWTGIAVTNDAEFDSIRALLQALDYGLDDF